MVDDGEHSDLAKLDAELGAARSRRDDARQAARRETALHQQIAESTRRCDALAASLSKEQRDVDRIEGISLTRVVLALSGHTEETLDAERAERDAVMLRLRTEQATLAALHKDLEAVAGQARDVDAAEADYLSLLAAKQELIEGSGNPQARLLHDVGEEITYCARQANEIDEARAAAHAAVTALRDVAERLDSAAAWSGFDLVGGGLVASMVKHSRLDEADAAAQHAQLALDRLSRELRDVAETLHEQLPDVSSGQRIIDVWFDNIFTDWSVNRKINDSRASIAASIDRICAIDAELAQRRSSADVAAHAADLRRRQILDPAAAP